MTVSHRALPLPGYADNAAVRVDWENGFSVELMRYGAALLSIFVPCRAGHSENVLCCYDDPADFVRSEAYLNMTVGPVAGRIGGASFQLGGVDYAIDANEGGNTLHGGRNNLSHTLWALDEPRVEADRVVLVLRKKLPDGYGGFPGNRSFTAEFSVEACGALGITYTTETDREAPANLTNHAYFDLSAQFDGSALRQHIAVNAHWVYLNDGAMLPRRRATVTGTPFDLRNAIPIDQAAQRGADAGLARQRGFDNAFELGQSRPQITLYDPHSQRRLSITTDQPAVQFYAGGFLAGQPPLVGGIRPVAGSGICLETQGNPFSFPSGAPMQTATPSRPVVQHTRLQFRG